MSRTFMPSAMPADRAEVLSDTESYVSPREEREHQLDLDRKAEELIRSEAWWDQELCGINEATNTLPSALARIMSNLDYACHDSVIARDAITTALSQVQRAARRMARIEVERDDE